MDDFLFKDYRLKEVHMNALSLIDESKSDALTMQVLVHYEVFDTYLLHIHFDIKVCQFTKEIMNASFIVQFKMTTFPKLIDDQFISKAVHVCQKDVLALVTHFLEMMVNSKEEVN